MLGSLTAVILLVSTMQQLNSASMRDVLQQVVDSPRAADLGLTIDAARTFMKYTIMVMAVLSVTSMVLGFYVLRRHRAARIALTVLGAVVAALSLLSGPSGWIAAVYVAASLVLLWTRPARRWFAKPQAPMAASPGPPWQSPPGQYPPPPDSRPPPPSGN